MVFMTTGENFMKKITLISLVTWSGKDWKKPLQKVQQLTVLSQNIRSEVLKWKLILTRLLDVTLFLAERSLPFRGNNEKISDPHNGLFLGICELLARYDKVLELHIASVKKAQNSSRRMQVTYLS